MDRRLELHEILCSILGSRNVYFQPPESKKLAYPCIIYRLSQIDEKFAGDRVYNYTKSYDITIVDKDPDSQIGDQLIKTLKMIRFNRFYTSNNLNHFVFIVYY